MKRLSFPFLIGVVIVFLWSCGTSHSIHRDKLESYNDSSLVYWMKMNDSTHIHQNDSMYLKVNKENLKRMQYELDKEKTNPYMGEMLYRLFRNMLEH